MATEKEAARPLEGRALSARTGGGLVSLCSELLQAELLIYSPCLITSGGARVQNSGVFLIDVFILIGIEA